MTYSYFVRFHDNVVNGVTMKRSASPSIKDVAKVAGVSFKSVARVLNGEEMVSDQLRDRVVDAVRKTGYIANAGARSMRSGKSGVVGFLSDVIATTPYSFDIIRGAQDELAARGLSMLIANTENDPAREERHINMFLENRVCGILYASMYHREVRLSPALPDNMRVIMVNCFDAGEKRPAVVPDDEQIGYTAARHLIDLGHRHIAYLTLHKSIIATPLRTKGFKRAMREAGLPAGSATVQESRRLRREGAEESRTVVLVEDMFRLPDPPTAVLAANDAEAMSIMGALHRMGVAIPDDVSVLGIDDYRLICEHMEPPLSSVALPYYEMGRRAVERLFEADPENGPGIERMPGPLVERKSVAAPRRSMLRRLA
jgi:LacI family transcriptional regulator